jgi:uncharacterized membrane protein
LCALSAGWLVAAPTALVLTVALVWGVTIVADSAQFSAIVTERAPEDSVGTALMLQTMAGFALTGIAIQLCSAIAASWGWGPAFAVLSLGPACGIVAMRRLQPDEGAGGSTVAARHDRTVSNT